MVDQEKIREKKKMPIWFKLLALTATLALVAVTIGILFTESWIDVVEAELSALRAQEFEKAYSTYMSQEFRSKNSLEAFRHFIEENPVFLHNDSAHFSERSMGDNIRILRGTVTSRDHLTLPVEYQLIKENGKWKILSVKVIVKSKKKAKKKKRLESLSESPTAASVSSASIRNSAPIADTPSLKHGVFERVCV